MPHHDKTHTHPAVCALRNGPQVANLESEPVHGLGKVRMERPVELHDDQYRRFSDKRYRNSQVFVLLDSRPQGWHVYSLNFRSRFDFLRDGYSNGFADADSDSHSHPLAHPDPNSNPE